MKLNIIIPLFLVFLFSLLTWFNSIFIFPLCISAIISPTFHLLSLSKDKRLNEIEKNIESNKELINNLTASLQLQGKIKNKFK